MTAINTITNKLNSFDEYKNTPMTDSIETNDNIKNQSVDTKFIDDAAAELDIDGSDTTTQPLTFAEGTSKKMKSVLNSYDVHSVFAELNQPQPPVIVTTKKFLPDGSVEITTKKDGQIVERSRKKPHMVSVKDPLSGKMKMEPFISVFEPDFM